jgi:hypothetical protein
MERRIEIEQVMLAAEPTSPRSTMEMEQTRDIGTLPQLEGRKVPFTVKNSGTKPLKLLRMRPDCDCTVINELPEKAIPPGGSAEVIVEFNGRGPEGPLKKGVTIFTDGEPATIRVVITGVLTHF